MNHSSGTATYTMNKAVHMLACLVSLEVCAKLNSYYTTLPEGNLLFYFVEHAHIMPSTTHCIDRYE